MCKLSRSQLCFFFAVGGGGGKGKCQVVAGLCWGRQE